MLNLLNAILQQKLKFHHCGNLFFTLILLYIIKLCFFILNIKIFNFSSNVKLTSKLFIIFLWYSIKYSNKVIRISNYSYDSIVYINDS